MADITLNEIVDIADRLAQELVEFVEAGEEVGSDMGAQRELLDEFDALRGRVDSYWLHRIKSLPGNGPSLLDTL